MASSYYPKMVKNCKAKEQLNPMPFGAIAIPRKAPQIPLRNDL